MQALKAVVKNGRLVLDEPTKLPEGTEVELLLVDDALDPEERARLLRSIEDGFADIERGDHMDAFEFVARVRAKPKAPEAAELLLRSHGDEADPEDANAVAAAWVSEIDRRVEQNEPGVSAEIVFSDARARLKRS